MKKIILFLFYLVFTCTIFSKAQTAVPVYFKGAIKEKKEILHRNIVQNTITKNLSYPLNEDTEEYWMDAFGGMELLQYKSPWADAKIFLAFDSIEKRTTGFQRALLELVYTNYPTQFSKQVSSMLSATTNAKVFAMCAEYLLVNNKLLLAGINFENKKQVLITSEKDEAIVKQLMNRLQSRLPEIKKDIITEIVASDFMNHQTVLYSFQRRSRNYPGLAMIKDSTGNFVKDEYGGMFSVPQLARSISNLPGYLTNGNTPQGVFRMHGFDTSRAAFIGPTTNIQLTMPFETSLQHFFKDSSIIDKVWSEAWYKKLLPSGLKHYMPLFESFYAGMAGRTEIIAHGTTVDPEYYVGQLYYPQTPTQGCLCTKEIWSEADGKRLQSDQQRLVAALQRAGGADGYCIVIEIDNEERPVSLSDILSLIKEQSSNEKGY
jgi:hypothetical protein